eukprot:TRINITY_DN499_c0_g1_i12.p1 TRINITY_DN499_c0_g1~~TRINITY_DN499_c0_g1_i12.p1  ORF type:complete len:417 (-),score=129.96 TRINITY_DN499_c0_g1_i12:387-1604(-)
MVRPVVNLSNRGTELSIATLKLSYDTKSNIRAPLVWEKPTASLYDYHYEIDGLYYQPMVSYCMGREVGARRQVVDIPDRILSNYDKRSYKLKNNEVDYEGFLTQCYQRRMKDVNSKKIRCANESVLRSKKTTDLGMARGSAMMRDKYLNQVQLMYTEKLARAGNIKGTTVENSGDARSTRSQSVECEEIKGENRILAKKRNDVRYGPAYERITVLDSERYNRGESVDFLPKTRARSEERAGVVSASKMEQSSSSMMEQSSSSKTVRMVKMTNSSGEVSEEFFSDSQFAGEKKKAAFMNKDYLVADNMNEFLEVRKSELEKKAANVAPEAVLYQDNTYSKALVDVRKRVKKEGDKYLVNQTQIDDLKLNYRGRTTEQVGKVEKAFIRSSMYNQAKLPDFDVGYDVV